ncbi:MAG: O-antigen ligase family protein [Acidobacteria bacterium]|nr:O-antigen ligase family protein [Acidobacteriota bacterium]
MTTISQPWPADWWRPARPAPPRGVPAATDSASAVSFWSLIALTAVMLLAPQSFIPALAPLRIALLAALFAASTYVFDRLKHGAPVLTFGPELRLCMALIVWAVVTIPFSMWPRGSVNMLLDLYLKSVIVFWLLASIVRSTTRLRQVAWTLTLIAIPLALTGVAHFASGDFYPPNRAIEERIIGYDAGLVKNPNDLALVLNLILPLTFALLLTERRAPYRLALAAIIGCQIAGVVATFSRSGFVTLATIGAVTLWRIGRRPGSRWLWVGLALALAALPVLPGKYLDRVSTIADKDDDPTGSAQARWNDQAIAVGYAFDHPLIGAGLGNDTLALNALRGQKWRQVHDLYLEYAVDLGLPGLAAFLLLFRRCVKAVASVQRRSAATPNSEVLFAVAEGVWISLLAFGVAAFFHPIAYHVYFYYMAGLAVAAKATCDAEVPA